MLILNSLYGGSVYLKVTNLPLKDAMSMRRTEVDSCQITNIFSHVDSSTFILLYVMSL